MNLKLNNLIDINDPIWEPMTPQPNPEVQMGFFRMIFVSFLSIIFMFLVSGCSSRIGVTTYELNTVIPEIVLPEPIQTKQVHFKIIDSDGVTYYALDSTNYVNLSYNMLEIQRYMESQKIIIENIQQYFQNLSEPN